MMRAPAPGARHGRLARRRLPGGRATIVATAGLTAVLASAGAAAAYWTSTGHGTGAGSSATISLSAGSVTASGLYPGGSLQVTFTVTATGPAGISVASVGPGATTVSGDSATCSPGTVTFTLNDTLPVAVVSGSATLHGTVTMSDSAESACQGRTFTIPLTVNGRL